MTETPIRLIIVEDDAEIRSLLSDYLARAGFEVSVAQSASAMDRLLAAGARPDLFILDVMLPGEDGLSICRRISAERIAPVIMLTARGEDVDRIVGLELGADDYLAKPFNPRELLARIKAVLRRAKAAPTAAKTRRFKLGAIEVDLDARSVRGADGAAIELTSAEFDLLQCFLERPGRVLSRDQLMDWTRGRRAEAFDRTIDVQVSRLRKKIERFSEDPLIRTHRSVGYALTAAVTQMGDEATGGLDA